LPQRSCHTAINLVIIAKSHRPVIDVVIIIAMTDAIAITSTIIIAKSHRPVIDIVIIIDIFVAIIIIDIVVDGMGWGTALWSTFWVSPHHSPYPHHPSATPTAPHAPRPISAEAAHPPRLA
jgi:hypothetical protein